MRTIVTHMSPDLDATTSCWLVQRFMPGWEEATVTFVPAGSTLEGKAPDEDPNIIHVDTGLGKFDHHQTSERTCAAKKVFEYLQNEGNLKTDTAEALNRIVKYVINIDHFGEIEYPDPSADQYLFDLPSLIDGLNTTLHNDTQVVELTYKLLDGVLVLLKARMKAEKELEHGFTFPTKWGKALALETKNEETMKLALYKGYQVVVRKDPDHGSIRIKTRPSKDIDLTPVYEAVQKADPQATWFLHASKNMLLNGSSKNPNSIPSKLEISKLIEILRGI